MKDHLYFRVFNKFIFGLDFGYWRRMRYGNRKPRISLGQWLWLFFVITFLPDKFMEEIRAKQK